MYHLDIDAFVKGSLPPYRRGKGLEKLARTLFRLDAPAYDAALLRSLRDARFVPQAGVIAAQVKAILVARGADPSVVVLVEDGPSGAPYDYVVRVPATNTAVTFDILERWIVEHRAEGKYGVLRGLNSLITPPPTPTAMVVRDVYYGANVPFANIQWTVNSTPTTATNVDLEVSVAGAAFTLVQRLGQDQHVFDHGPVTAGVTYVFRVRNYDARTGLYSPYLTSGSFQIGTTNSANQAPVLSGFRSGGTVPLTWTHPGGAANFELWRAVGGGSYALYTTLGGGVYAFTDVQASAAAYKIRATGSGFQSAFSNEVSVSLYNNQQSSMPFTVIHAQNGGDGSEVIRLVYNGVGSNGGMTFKDTATPFIPSGMQKYYVWDEDLDHPFTGDISTIEWSLYYNGNLLCTISKDTTYEDYPQPDPGYVSMVASAEFHTGDGQS